MRLIAGLRSFVTLTLALAIWSIGPGAEAQSPFDFFKLFSPDTVGPGGTSTLTFTITNKTSTPADDVAFTDVLPVLPDAMTIAGGGASTTCTNATLSAPAGGGTISLGDAQLGAFGTCTVTVDVAAGGVAGSYDNVTGDLTSSIGGGGTASDSLIVDTTLPSFSKSLSPSTVAFGGTSTVTYLIDNIANASGVEMLDFNETFPTGITIASPTNASTTCGTPTIPPTLTASAGGSTITLDANGTGGFPAVAAGATCTVTVNVVGASVGAHTLTSSQLLAEFEPAGASSAVLTVTSSGTVDISKDFTDDPVAAGGTGTLEFTIRNTDRVFPATAVGFTDDLAAMLAGTTFDSLLFNDCGASVSGTGTGLITVSGGTIAPEGFCTISVAFTVPGGTSTSTVTNNTSAVTATIDGSGVTGNVATADLSVTAAAPLVFTKSFLDDPVNAGDSTRMQFTFENRNPVGSGDFNATDISFVDDLTAFMPFPVSATLPASPCGGAISLISPFDESQSLSYTGGSVAEGATCSFEVVLDIPATMAGGTYTNTTGELTASLGDAGILTSPPASASFTVGGGLNVNFIKEFTDDPVIAGNTANLRFTISSAAESTVDMTGVTFTDDLDAMLTGTTAAGLPLTAVCGDGTLAGSAGDTFLTLSGATISPGESCVFDVTVNVPGGAASGNYPNTTSQLTGNAGATPVAFAAASDTLEVYAADSAPVQLVKSFIDDPVAPGGATTLRFTLTNPNATSLATGIQFFDNFAAMSLGLTAASYGAIANNTCDVTPTFPLENFLQFTGGSLVAGASCSFELPITVPGAAAVGSYGNTTTAPTATVNGALRTGTPATDQLRVIGEILTWTKEFTDDPVAAGGTATMVLTIDNLSPSSTATAIAFTDDLSGMGLPAGAEFSGANTNTCGGMAGGFPTSSFSYAGGSLGPGLTCEISLNLEVPAAATPGGYTNTTGTLDYDVGAGSFSTAAASDTLQVLDPSAPTFTKAFGNGGLSAPGGTIDLTFTIVNNDASDLIGLRFTDDLGAMLSGATAVTLPAAPCGAGSSITGTGVLTLNDGEIAGNGNCVFVVSVQVPAGAAPGSYTNTTGNLTSSGTLLAGPATANLTIPPPPTLTKAFSTNAAEEGEALTLTLSIDNGASALPATAVTLGDLFPAGLVVSTAASGDAGCTGGTIDGAVGATGISYTGGTVAAGATCVITAGVTITEGNNLVNTATLTSSLGASPDAQDSITVTAASVLDFAKAFAAASADQGETLGLSLTLTNPNTFLTATDAAFVDNFPSGLILATAPTASAECGGPTITGAVGDAGFSFGAGTIAPGDVCTVSMTVTVTEGANQINTTGDLTSSLGNSGPASDTLSVTAATVLDFVKAFAAASADQGETLGMDFTLTNGNRFLDATDVAFVDNFPSGLILASVPSASAECGGPTITGAVGDASFSVSGGTIASGDVCTISMTVTVTEGANQINTTGDLTSSLGNSGPASDTLSVTPAPAPGFAKAYSPATITVFGTSTLSFTIDNSAALVPATALAFIDTLDPSILISRSVPASTTCTGGTLTAAEGTSAISLSGASVAAGASCTVTVPVVASAEGVFPNTAGPLTSSLGNSGTAAATLTVEAPITGNLTIVQRSDPDGLYGFSSSEASLNFQIQTAGGIGTFGPVSLAPGSYTISQTPPDGFGTLEIVCDDADSTGDPAARTMNINIAAGESILCELSSFRTDQKTVDTINRLLSKRANFMLSTEPRLGRRIDRLNNGFDNSAPTRFATGDVMSMSPFRFDPLTIGSDNVQVSGSLLTARQAAANIALAHGSTKEVAYVDNYRFDAWFEAHYKRFDEGAKGEGHFGILYLGADYLVNRDLLIGALVQIDRIEDNSVALNTSANGTGWMAGPYMTARLAPNLYFDARVAAGAATNEVSPFNTYIDEFDSFRWLAVANLTGEFHRGNWTIRPNASLAYYQETQDSYVDSLGVAIPSQTVELGQLKIGPTFSGRFEAENGMFYEPYLTVEGIYNIAGTSGVTLGGQGGSESEGWRGRVQAGLSFSTEGGGRISLGLNYDGIGRDDYEAYGAALDVTIPLYKAIAR